MEKGVTNSPCRSMPGKSLQRKRELWNSARSAPAFVKHSQPFWNGIVLFPHTFPALLERDCAVPGPAPVPRNAEPMETPWEGGTRPGQPWGSGSSDLRPALLSLRVGHLWDICGTFPAPC